MVEAARARGAISSVWYGGPKEKSGENKSAEYTCEWLQEQALLPDLPFEGESAIVLRHFHIDRIGASQGFLTLKHR